MILGHERDRANQFFQEVAHNHAPFNVTGRSASGVALIAVTHVLPDRSEFFEGARAMFDIAGVLPKPKSRDEKQIARLREDGFIVVDIDRSISEDVDAMLGVLRPIWPSDRPVVLLDIGGYFARSIGAIKDTYGDAFLGVVEDTENGHKRYLEARRQWPDIPVISVARSPLKDSEDYLVGKSIVHSAEHLMRVARQSPNGKFATVIGFGKIGQSVAEDLRSRGIQVAVVENDRERAVKAWGRGFEVMEHSDALRSADLIIGATGSGQQRSWSVTSSDLLHIKPGAFLASVTSCEDEFELDVLKKTRAWTRVDVADSVAEYTSAGGSMYFYLLNEGNAVNFIHGAVVDSYIYLVQAEMLVAAAELAMEPERVPPEGQLREVAKSKRQDIAAIWLRTFKPALRR